MINTIVIFARMAAKCYLACKKKKKKKGKGKKRKKTVYEIPEKRTNNNTYTLDNDILHARAELYQLNLPTHYIHMQSKTMYYLLITYNTANTITTLEQKRTHARTHTRACTERGGGGGSRHSHAK